MLHIYTHVVCEVGYVRSQTWNQKLQQRTVAHTAGNIHEMHRHTFLFLGMSPCISQRHVHEKTDGRRQGVKRIRANPRPLKN